MALRVWALVDKSAEGDAVLCRTLLRSVARREALRGRLTLPEHWDVTDIQWSRNQWEAFIRDQVATAGTICGASHRE
jgi:hypothetical protein